MTTRYTFTNHARKRFRERLSHLVKDQNVCKSIAEQIQTARPDNSIKNNTRFMTKLHEEHGYNPFEFLVNGDMVFVCRGEYLVTVYPKKDSKFHRPQSRFKKKLPVGAES